MNLLKRAHLFQYAFLAMPLAFAGLPIYIHAPDFYALNLNTSLALIGFVLLFLRLIDAIQDPLIGALSDRYHHHRSKIIFGGLTALMIGFFALFNPTQSLQNSLWAVVWMAVSVFVCTTGFSIVTINMQALGGLWKTDVKQIPRIMTWREAMALIGLLIGSILPTVLLLSFEPFEAYRTLSFMIIPLIMISGVIFLKWLKKTEFDQSSSTQSLSVRAIFSDRSVLNLYLIFLVSGIASAIPATLVLFFIRDYLGAEEYTGLFLLIYFLSGVVAMPLWQLIAKRKSSIFGLLVSMILASIVFVGASLLSAGDIIAYGIICVLSGVAVGGDLAFPPMIIAEIIKKNNHQDAASMYYAVSAFVSKGALAFATGIALPMLTFYGYQPGQETSDMSLPIAYALIPCFIKLLSACLLWRLIGSADFMKKVK